MTRTWFDRCYGELLMADAVQRDPRLTALWEAEDCTAVKEASGNSVQQYIMAHGRGAEPTLKTSEVMDGTGVSVQQLVDMHRRGDVTLSYWSGTPQSWPGRTEQMIAQRGSSMVPWDGKVDLDGRLYGWVRVPADAMAKLKECDDMTAKTEEAAGVLNTFSTRGSIGVNMTVKKIGSGFFVLFTSGSIVDGVAYKTREEALGAARRLAAAEGVRVEEDSGIPHDSSEKGKMDRFGSTVIRRANQDFGDIGSSKIRGMVVRGDWSGLLSYLASQDDEEDQRYRMFGNFVRQEADRQRVSL